MNRYKHRLRRTTATAVATCAGCDQRWDGAAQAVVGPAAAHVRGSGHSVSVSTEFSMDAYPSKWMERER